MAIKLRTKEADIGFTLVGPPANEDGDLYALNWRPLRKETQLPTAHFRVSRCKIEKKGLGALTTVIPIGDSVEGMSFVPGTGGMIGQRQIPAGQRGTLPNLNVEFEMV